MTPESTAIRPYTPRDGTAAHRAVAILQELDGAELSTAALAERLHYPPSGLPTALEGPLKAGLLFKRKKDAHPRSPYFWSSRDHSPRPVVPPPGPQEPIAAAAPAEPPAPVTAVEPDASSPAARGDQEPHGLLPEHVAWLQRSESRAKASAGRLRAVRVEQPLRFALWSDGELQISRGADDLLRLDGEDTRALLAYLNRIDLPESVYPTLEVRHATRG